MRLRREQPKQHLGRAGRGLTIFQPRHAGPVEPQPFGELPLGQIEALTQRANVDGRVAHAQNVRYAQRQVKAKRTLAACKMHI
ncbi:hypothetical protein GCM10008171_32580 [Methylopila jiangsuensis]|uniref:Uncharacterized protein n=1 Tax=Methylopila jiangsuensis TaxID=586230 RepID=A0A9W6JLP5_9HYPH|nr:hypothetical protein GCM10008171_32580 [Methylopila jiangsuensis]